MLVMLKSTLTGRVRSRGSLKTGMWNGSIEMMSKSARSQEREPIMIFTRLRIPFAMFTSPYHWFRCVWCDYRQSQYIPYLLSGIFLLNQLKTIISTISSLAPGWIFWDLRNLPQVTRNGIHETMMVRTPAMQMRNISFTKLYTDCLLLIFNLSLWE